jgi:hypothetical protein
MQRQKLSRAAQSANRECELKAQTALASGVRKHIEPTQGPEISYLI